MKTFCILTYGRTGSSSFINSLQHFDDINTPGKSHLGIDDELLHPAHVANHAMKYSGYLNRNISTSSELVQAFFDSTSASTFAGFKTMPNWHRDFPAFVGQSGMQNIVLTREDIASTVASFFVATTTGEWRRVNPVIHFTIDISRYKKQLTGFAHYVLEMKTVLDNVPNAIRVTYEQLCSEEFSSGELDDYFGRPIHLLTFKPPTHCKEYIENWDEFNAFIMNYLKFKKRIQGDLIGPC